MEGKGTDRIDRLIRISGWVVVVSVVIFLLAASFYVHTAGAEHGRSVIGVQRDSILIAVIGIIDVLGVFGRRRALVDLSCLCWGGLGLLLLALVFNGKIDVFLRAVFALTAVGSLLLCTARAILSRRIRTSDIEH